MDASALVYKVDMIMPQSLLRKAAKEALDILFSLGLDPKLDRYQRARLLLFSADLAPTIEERLVYAEECLWLIETHDLHCTREESEDIWAAVQDTLEEIRATKDPVIKPDATVSSSDSAGRSHSEGLLVDCSSSDTQGQGAAMGRSDMDLFERTLEEKAAFEVSEGHIDEQRGHEDDLMGKDVVVWFTSRSERSPEDRDAWIGDILQRRLSDRGHA